MGKKKSATQTTQTYGWMTPPPNKYFDAAAQQVEGYDGGRSEIISNYGRARNEINNSGNEFFGNNTTDEVRNKTRENRLFRSTLDMGRDLSAAEQNKAAYKNAAYMSLGGATAPQLVSTGGTQNNQQWGSGLYSPLGQFGLQAAMAGLGA